MPAAVESMTYFGAVPWHGLGSPIPVEERYNLAAGRLRAGLDWGVTLEPLYMQQLVGDVNFGESQRAEYVAVEQAKAVVRDTDKRVLGVVGPRYTPLQNREAFDWFQPMFDAKLCALNTAGSLCDGEKVWILAEIMGAKPIEIVRGDEVGRFLMISNSHDGTTSVRVGFTPVRVVCANTLAMAHNSAASKLIRLRHHKDIKLNLDKVRDIINLANQEFEATAEQYRLLASRHINQVDLKKYVRLAAGVDESVKDEDVPTRTQNIMLDMLNKIAGGIGQGIERVKGTWWAAYNGVNEYLNYSKGRTPSNRLDNLWFGTGTADNVKLLDAAIALASKSGS